MLSGLFVANKSGTPWVFGYEDPVFRGFQLNQRVKEGGSVQSELSKFSMLIITKSDLSDLKATNTVAVIR
jgi:hypothetical protein